MASTTTATSPSTPYASASLYVGDLLPEVTEALLFDIFNGVGPVASVRVCRNAQTRRSLGYAYVNFHRVDDAERALDTMNFKPVRGKPCRIMWSHRDPTLRKSGVGNIFVKHLAKMIDNKSLYDTFSMFGNILSCKVATNNKGESLGYGFVHYESEEAAQTAIARVDGKVIAGQKVEVSAFKSKKERGGLNKNKFTNIYVKNLPEDITKEKVDELFGKYGKITSSMIAFEKENKTRAFGFINYSTPEEAQASVEGMNGFEISGKKIYVARAQKKEERAKELIERFEQLKVDRQKKWAGVNLYVKNLADDITDDRLREEFSKFGSIQSARVMADQNHKSRGFGFVCFNTPEEATKAVTEMNGRLVENKPLYVALAQRKEVRRAQLEAQYAARAKLGVPVGQPMYPPHQGMFYPSPGVGVARPQFAGWTGAPGGQGPGQVPLIGMPRAPLQYQLMPVTNGPGGRGGPSPNRGPVAGAPTAGVPGGRRQRNGQQAGPKGQMGVAGQPQGYKYTENVRNRDQRPVQPPSPSQGASVPEPALPIQSSQPLTIKALAAAPEEQKKQMIGEQLFPLIKERLVKDRQDEQLAGKITGMLLEMDNSDLIELLESRDSLNDKIDEALLVLRQHPLELAAAAEK
jgi:polyadenylate-binding protein